MSERNENPKEAMRPFIPGRILRRRKAGFSGPVRAWIRNEYREPIRELIIPLFPLHYIRTREARSVSPFPAIISIIVMLC